MIGQAIDSVVVGGGISIVLFIPFLIWQYRRFGRPSAGRLAGYVAGLVYLTALLTYTLFPLPDMSGDYCARHSHSPVLDPLAYFVDMSRTYAGRPLWEVLRSWELLQMVLNVALFVPLGVFARRFAGWGVLPTLGAGLATSVMVEATQLTGNWHLMPCAYRQADVNDLITNTTGTAVGIALTALLPRLVADPAYLIAHRDQARPLTRMRRWTAMLLDFWYWLVFAGTTIAVALAIVMGIVLDVRTLSNSDWRGALVVCGISALVIGLVMALVPALTDNGASLGQRTVYLEPFPRNGSRWRQVVRALSVQGVGLAGALVLPWQVAIPALLWVLVAIASVAIAPRGLSCVLSRCELRDSRMPDRTTKPANLHG